MADPEIGEVIKDITADVQTIIKGEIELAKAELMPQVKKAGFGAGMFGVAGYLGLQAATLLFICVGLALSALYQGVVPTIWAFVLGFLTLTVLLLIIAGVLVLVGKGKFAFTGAPKTVDEANRSISAFTGAIDQGNANVRAIVAGAPRVAVGASPEVGA